MLLRNTPGLSAGLVAALLGATQPASAQAHTPPLSAGASYLRHEDFRVGRVGYRIALAGARYCPEPYPLTGLLLHHLAEYRAQDRAEAARLYSLDRGLGLLAITENSPAAAAGLKAGDVLLRVNAQPFRDSAALASDGGSKQVRLAIEASEGQLEAQLRKGPARLDLLREGREFSATLTPIMGCPGRVRLARSNQVNAFANRGYAIMTDSLLRFMQSDDELAIVLGHELAHTILNHRQQLDELGVPRGFLSEFGKNPGRIRATEEAADRLGLKLAWAAGYDPAAAIPYWRRYYGKYSTMSAIFRTHPTLEARERLIREVVAELGPRPSDSGAQRPELRESALGER